MAKLAKIVAKFRGDKVELFRFDRATGGRSIGRARVRCSVDELKAGLPESVLQETLNMPEDTARLSQAD